MSKSKRRILFLGEAVTLSHVVRPVVLAQSLDTERYEVFVACDPRYQSLFANLPFPLIPLKSSSPAENIAERLASGQPLFDLDTLDAYVQEDLQLFRELTPDAVVGDMRQSLAVSSRLASVPYINIVNAQWSPASPLPRELPRNPLAPLLGQPLSDFLVSLAAPLGLSPHVAPLNLLRLKYGLQPLDWDVRHIYSYGDMTLYPDIPELVPTDNLPPTHHYIGPVLWSPEVDEPAWWKEVPEDKPIVYVNLGSSGQGKLLRVVLDALARLPLTVIAATAGADARQLGAIPANTYVADYLPGEEAAKRSQVVICNGGNMSAQQALACGVPVLGLASNVDQLLFARAVSRAGAGEALREGETDEGGIRHLTWKILVRKSYAEAAQRVSKAYAEREAGAEFRRRVASFLMESATFSA